MASRALLFPGPAPPLSHLGVTLLRYVVVTGLRYTIYQLGLPPPEAPPILIHRLRLYLDNRALASALGDTPEARELVQALVDPGGVAQASSLEHRLAGAAAFHRLRLRLASLKRVSGRRSRFRNGGSWQDLHRELSCQLPGLRDAFLGEVLSSLARRTKRRRGGTAPPCLSDQAWRLRTGRRSRLEFLGDPDLKTASWNQQPGRAESAVAALAGQSVPPRHPLRGRFREHYRETLDCLRPGLLSLAQDTVRRGLLERTEEIFFLPFELVEELQSPDRQDWLQSAVGSNRREYESLLETPSPPEELAADLETSADPGEPANWCWQPLSPLL